MSPDRDPATRSRRTFELVEEFLPLFHKCVLPAFQPDLKESLGLSKSQARALMMVRRKGPSTATDIGACLAMTKANLTVLVDELEEAGLVRREDDPGDRRKSLVGITDRGAAAARAIEARIEEALADRLSSLTAAESRRFEDGLASLISVLKTLQE